MTFPLVQTLSWSSSESEDLNNALTTHLLGEDDQHLWGLKIKLTGDVLIGWNMPVYSGEEAGRTMFVVNPQVYGHVGFKNNLYLYLGPVHLKFKFQPYLANAKFIDTDLMISEIPDARTDLDWCLGINYVIKLFDVKVKLEASVYTCQYPMLGTAIGDLDDCLWMWYPVAQPLLDIQTIFKTLKLLNIEGEIFPWTCSYDYYAELMENTD